MSLVLPTSKIPAVSVNPKFLIIYGRPKAGKTSALAQLESNLIIDLEGGSQFIDAMAVQARSVNELGEIAQAIRAKNKEVGHNFISISLLIMLLVWKKFVFHMQNCFT